MKKHVTRLASAVASSLLCSISCHEPSNAITESRHCPSKTPHTPFEYACHLNVLDSLQVQLMFTASKVGNVLEAQMELTALKFLSDLQVINLFRPIL